MGIHNESKPTLPERYKEFLDLATLRKMIDDLQIAYSETKNEKVHRVMTKLTKVHDEFWSLEDMYRDEELQEFFRNPGKYPWSVRIWMLAYREDENK